MKPSCSNEAHSKLQRNSLVSHLTYSTHYIEFYSPGQNMSNFRHPNCENGCHVLDEHFLCRICFFLFFLGLEPKLLSSFIVFIAFYSSALAKQGFSEHIFCLLIRKSGASVMVDVVIKSFSLKPENSTILLLECSLLLLQSRKK